MQEQSVSPLLFESFIERDTGYLWTSQLRAIDLTVSGGNAPYSL